MGGAIAASGVWFLCGAWPREGGALPPALLFAALGLALPLRSGEASFRLSS